MRGVILVKFRLEVMDNYTRTVYIIIHKALVTALISKR